MTDRLTIINDALAGTGNNEVNVEFDGSTEWRFADRAYRRALQFIIPRHTWSFASTTSPLAGLLAESPHPDYDKAYQLPGDVMLVEKAWVDGRDLTEYEVIDQKFCCRFDSSVVVKYIRAPLPGQWPPLFAELLTRQVEAYILSGLNEDTDNARRKSGEVEILLDEVRSSLDRQEPARAVFKSRSAWRRLGGHSMSRTRLGRPPYGGVG